MVSVNSGQSNCLNLEKLGVKISKVTFPIADKRRLYNTGLLVGQGLIFHVICDC